MREIESKEKKNLLTEEEYDWLWLCCVPGLFPGDRKKLLELYETPKEIRKAAAKDDLRLLQLGEKKRAAIVAQQRNLSPKDAYEAFQKKNIFFASCISEAYPGQLLELYDAPCGLFYKGSLPQEETCIAIVGARKCSSYGRQMARKLGRRLAENGICVVSGMAYGIDGEAQQACLDGGARSFGILGSGVDICYPLQHRKLYDSLCISGGVISEYPPGTQALSANFPYRNRIISGLAKKVVIVEAKKKSGTLITADQALEQGRDIYAFPGRVDDLLSEGCNRLIAQGAGIITDLDEFLREFGCTGKDAKKQRKKSMDLSPQETAVYSCMDSRVISLAEIHGKCGLQLPQVISALFGLQMKGLIEENAKNYYTKIC